MKDQVVKRQKELDNMKVKTFDTQKMIQDIHEEMDAIKMKEAQQSKQLLNKYGPDSKKGFYTNVNDPLYAYSDSFKNELKSMRHKSIMSQRSNELY